MLGDEEIVAMLEKIGGATQPMSGRTLTEMEKEDILIKDRKEITRVLRF